MLLLLFAIFWLPFDAVAVVYVMVFLLLLATCTVTPFSVVCAFAANFGSLTVEKPTLAAFDPRTILQLICSPLT